VLKKKRLVIEPIQNTNLIDRTVILEPGNNIISVSARTENAVSQPATVYITYQTQSLKKPNLFLLAVGVSTYADSRYNLRYADKDAKAMANLFQNQAGKLFNIINGLSWLKQTGQADVAVAFISGHGAYDQNRDYYFIPHDVDPRRLKRTGVNWQHFHDTLSSLPSKALLFVDTCHAGNVTGRARGSRDLDINKIIADLATDESGVVVMASSTGREISVEDESWGHGAFTLALIEGLSGQADYNRDGAVYITEIDNYVTDRVKALTNRKQHPTTQKPTTVRSFPLVLVQ
jgi:uncharacterized caspase-like protein